MPKFNNECRCSPSPYICFHDIERENFTVSVCLPNHTTTVCVCVSARVFVCLCVNYYTKYTTKKIQITELFLYMFSGNTNTLNC